jgi:hypothetical protein
MQHAVCSGHQFGLRSRPAAARTHLRFKETRA